MSAAVDVFVQQSAPIWERGMNSEQLEAIRHDSGPIQLLAPAGCHRRGQLILMADGTREAVEDVEVGNHVMGWDGTPRRVSGLARGEATMIRICPVKGDSFVVNEDHVLTLVETSTDKVVDVTVRDWLGWSDWARQNHKLFRRGVATFHSPRETYTPIHPYFLGVLIGDGSIVQSVGVTSIDPEIHEELREQARIHGLSIRVDGDGGSTTTYTLTSGRGLGEPRTRNMLTEYLGELGLYGTKSGTKFIPNSYLFASREDRLALLAGLLDTDGSLGCGYFDFVTKSQRLADGVVFLSRGLGFAAYLSECEKHDQHGAGGTYYRIGISGNVSEIPTRIPRKRADPRRQKKDVLRTGIAHYEILGVEKYFGFTIEGDGRYLLGDLTVTHNSGKTRVICHRVARMVETGVVAPDRVFMVTFSRKAADEMDARMQHLGISGVTCQTWHAFCLRVLKDDATQYGQWTIDEKDRAKVHVKKAMGHEHENWIGADLTKVRRFIGHCKANLWDVDSAQARAHAEKVFGHQASRAIRVFAISQDAIENNGLLTFDDMLVYVHRHFAQSEEARLAWAGRFDQVLQDEGQDANAAQVAIANQLARDHRNYMIIGDAQQAIYSFRGSSPAYLNDFATVWSAKQVAMVRNYRSGTAIVNLANAVIQPATMRTPDMVAERDGGAFEGRVEVVACDVLEDEGRELVDFVNRHKDGGGSYSDVCCLFRLNAQSRAIEEAFLKARVPYVLIGGTNFYERKEVKDLLAYLRVAHGRDVDGDGVRRCINAPFRFLGAKFVEKVQQCAQDVPDGELIPWVEVVDNAAKISGIQSRQRSSAGEWVGIIQEVERRCDDDERPADVLDFLIRKTGYLAWLEKEEGEESIESSHAANVRELVRVAQNFGTVEELLDYVDENVRQSAKQRRNAPRDAVTLMSIHRCVSPTTLVETAEGIQQIYDVGQEGVIATAEGAARFEQKVGYEDRDMIRLTTKSGYSIEVTADHGMMVWSYADGDYVQKKAGALKKGEFLRLRLGATIDVANAELPPLPEYAALARKHISPATVTSEAAEFFGLMVADGTVFRGGFRLKKRHADVTHRFADLTSQLFGRRVEVTRGDNTFDCEFDSIQVSAWIGSIGGMCPKQKAVPDVVLRSSLRSQAAFLRGLFEDGTVNVAEGRLDHIAWSTCYPRMAKIVQTLLLRQGIISARKLRFGQWRVEIYGSNAHKFRDAIGFVSGYKNGLLQFPTGAEEGYVVPVETDRLRAVHPVYGTPAHWARQNGISRGYVSRAAAKLIGGYEAELAFHHEKIASIETFRGPAMCVSVPRVGRFLQDGFDGCNSKGLEWPVVWVVGVNDQILPHARGDEEEERRLLYVAVTRARDHLVLSHVREMATRTGLKTVERSRFLDGITIGTRVPKEPVQVSLLAEVVS